MYNMYETRKVNSFIIIVSFSCRMRDVLYFLKQELLTFLRMMGSGNLTARAFKRLRNVLTLFQAIELQNVLFFFPEMN